jgi:hypothetical protein
MKNILFTVVFAAMALVVAGAPATDCPSDVVVSLQRHPNCEHFSNFALC